MAYIHCVIGKYFPNDKNDKNVKCFTCFCTQGFQTAQTPITHPPGTNLSAADEREQRTLTPSRTHNADYTATQNGTMRKKIHLKYGLSTFSESDVI